MITNIKNEDTNRVLEELQTLAKQLQDKQSELGTNPRQAKLGDAVVFASDEFHAGAAPFVNEDAGDKFEDYPRVMSYMEFAPKVVVEEEKWWPLLETLYNSEEVFDRRSMVDPRINAAEHDGTAWRGPACGSTSQAVAGYDHCRLQVAYSNVL